MDGDARDDAPESLTIPPWVPGAVSKAARALYSDADQRGRIECIPVLQRLVSDPRMRPVWAELVKRTRKEDRSFFHPAEPAWEIPDSAEERQTRAIGSLVYLAVNLVVDSPRVVTRRQVETTRRKALDAASVLRKAAKLLSLPDPALNAARNHEGEAAAWAAAGSSRLVVERDRGDAQAKCFAIVFASQCRQLFGCPLYGVTATVASVALGRKRKLTRRAVREWVSTTRDICG
jgi:hypothetical protein